MRLIGRRKVFANQDLRVRAGTVRPPNLFASIEVISSDKTTHAELTATDTGNHFVADHQRRHGNSLALFRIALFHFPQKLTGVGIQSDRRSVELVEEDLAFGVGCPTIDHVAAGNRNGVGVLFRFIFPLDRRTRLGQIQSIDDVRERSDQIHRSANHQRRAFVATQNAGGECPSDLEVLDVGGGDLVQLTVARERVVLPWQYPLVWIFLHLHQPLAIADARYEQEPGKEKKRLQYSPEPCPPPYVHKSLLI